MIEQIANQKEVELLNALDKSAMRQIKGKGGATGSAITNNTWLSKTATTQTSTAGTATNNPNG